MIKVFSDFHHAGLLNSLILLFEGRFGGQLYRPIGNEWHTKGYWKIYDHPATVEQYLGINGATPDGSPSLNQMVPESYTEKAMKDALEGIYLCHDIDSGKVNKAITFDAFMRMDIDFVIASIPAHIEPFRKLCDAHPNRPKLIYQIGNSWNIQDTQYELVDAILSSAKINYQYKKPYIQYHQEFDLKVFNYEPGVVPAGDVISSLVNCFSEASIFQTDWAIFQEVEKLMPHYTFYSFGGQCRDGNASGSEDVAKSIRLSKFIWHTKNGGDGYGHIIHNAYAMGRPVITRMSDYIGKMAQSLLKPDETCIAIDGLSAQEIVNKITYYSDAARYIEMSHKAHKAFEASVDFNAEAQKIKTMLDSLRA